MAPRCGVTVSPSAPGQEKRNTRVEQLRATYFPIPKGNALITRRTPNFVHGIKRMRRVKTLREKYICFVFSEIML